MPHEAHPSSTGARHDRRRIFGIFAVIGLLTSIWFGPSLLKQASSKPTYTSPPFTLQGAKDLTTRQHKKFGRILLKRLKRYRKRLEDLVRYARSSRDSRAVDCLGQRLIQIRALLRVVKRSWKKLRSSRNRQVRVQAYYRMAKFTKKAYELKQQADRCKVHRKLAGQLSKKNVAGGIRRYKLLAREARRNMRLHRRVRRLRRRSRRLRRPRSLLPQPMVAPTRAQRSPVPSALAAPSPSAAGAPPPMEDSPLAADRGTTQGLRGGGFAGGARRGPSGRVAQETARRGRAKEDKKGKSKRRKPQVWQRSRTNTVLSKVSVGGGKYLKLQKMRVSVRVEGMRVRTIIDHIYRNPYNRTLQGTFKYTLPPDASVSYYAMFVSQRRRRTPRFFRGKGPSPRRLLRMQPQQIARTSPARGWGRLREARLVPAEKGRQVYEKITRRRIDPALLEQDAPNTFTGRVFPIPARGYNRVIIAYEQTLPQIQEQHVYRFRFPPDVAKVIDFTLGYNKTHSSLVRNNLRKLRCRSNKNKPFLRCYWENNKPKRDAVFYFKPKQNNVAAIAGTDPMNSQKYMLSQIRVPLPKAPTRSLTSQAIFMLDTSLSANPDLFGAHVALLSKILQKNSSLKRFNVLFFDVNSVWAKPSGWIANTSRERRRLLRRLNKIVLEGATDFGAAMRTLAHPSWLSQKGKSAQKALDVFVLSDGQLNWGRRQVDKILYQFQQRKRWKQVRFLAYQTGIGSENLGFLRRLVRRGGALFPCLGRAELKRCATAHNKPAMLLQKVKVEGIQASQIMVAGRQTSIYPDGLITVAAQYKRNGTAKITLMGQYLNKPFRRTIQVKVTAHGDLGPRAWGEMAVAQLMELEDPKLTKLIVAYSQHFRIPNKHCSYLILETDKEYKQYGLDKELKTQKVKDVAQFIVRLLQAKEAPLTERQRWIAQLRKAIKKFKGLRQSSGRAVMNLLHSLPKSDFQFATATQGRLWNKGAVPDSYLKQRLKDRNQFGPFVKEAKRRLPKHLNGAIRSLSSIIELHPSNAQALRLVGYYLRAWNKPKLAVPVFFRVLERRSFEPHTYRDVAISLVRMKRYGLAAALYEVMLMGKWHSRFKSFKRLAREEYALLLYQAFQYGKMPTSILQVLKQRKSMLGLNVKAAGLRVTVTWNTDNTDIDLWVTGPKGHKCFYSRKSTPDGGRLLEDITRGYGPERYQNVIPIPGTYRVQLKFYGHSSNVFGNETHISIMIVHGAGTPGQEIVYKNLILRKRKQIVDVARIQI